MAGHRSPGGYGHMPSSNIRQAWYETDDQYSPTSRQRYSENTNARHGREAGRQSQTTEQEMDVDSSDDTRREKMPMKNIEELFLKLEGLPTLIQNSKQEMREWKQLLSTRSSDETLKLKEEIEKLRMENQTLKSHHDRISSNRNDEKALEQELQKAKQKNEEYKNVNSKIIREYQKAEEKIKRIEQTVAEDQRSIDKITRECESVKEQMSALQNRYQAAYDEKVKIGKELSESKSRLSRMMGNKLGDNNPDIADLSDKNRPTKLAEKNTELYDNEWTDAFEVFQTKYATEKETIEKLLQMLQDIKVECDQIAQEQVQKLSEAMKMKRSRERLRAHTFKQLKDFRRFTAEESLPEVIEKCLNKFRHKDYQKVLSNEGVVKFVKGCVELCWFMNVQDPPLVFGDIPNKNDEFDSNYFKFYTSTGSKFEYMVWPALLLEKDGAILSKGVAQASGEQKAESQRRKTRNAEAGRNNVGSGSNRQNKDDHYRSDGDTVKTHSYDGNDGLSPNHESQNVHDQNYQQSVVGTSSHLSDKRTFSRTGYKPEKSTAVGRISNNFASSQREDEPGSSKKQLLKTVGCPNWDQYWKFKDLMRLYGIDSPVVISGMGKDYASCKDYYIYVHGMKSTESDV